MTVSNSTVLISLIKIGRIDLVKNIFKKIVISDTINRELTERQDLYKNEIKIFNELLANGFIIVKRPKEVVDFELHKGENSCLSLCKEINDKMFLSDDKDARKAADSLGVEVVGTLGILILNLERGRTSKTEFFEIMRKLVDKGFYISTDLFASVEEYVNKRF